MTGQNSRTKGIAVSFRGSDDIETALSMLAATLEARGVAAVELVVIGGAAFNLLGLTIRPTKDVDVLALCKDPESGGSPILVKHKPLPGPVLSAAAFVADALGLPPGWLNAGPADLLDGRLPDGFEGRLTVRRFGSRLAIHTPAREDLICLKVYAAADTGVGRHTQDLDALRPTCDELVAGARWARTQDPSAGFRTMLAGLLRHYGCDRAAEVFSDGD